ncbi:D-cysteine desulfhydrase family protein [Paenibacillus beijingensis]|uniref:Cysteine desulfhydrase n=1 Tax=Paenibacillus beijingensis TaxID=1126833 RepID=A0A0D5NKU6_9BACL|nr:D-cysteine desulfhydrase family protein [Paenibacillus beijingensis]AJY75558.1 cysteine desulfhydrase [Paenibacillus beijingensis]
MTNIPDRVPLANLPTKIEKLERLSAQLGGPSLFIKRDDQTGTEFSGNKVRKLEYSLKEALAAGHDYVITCGGIQSNHCRSTAAAAAKLGLKSYLVLRGNEPQEPDGNLLLDHLLGAQIRYITAEEYRERRAEIMESVKDKLTGQGYKPYIIPEGASNGIGSFGYYTALREIVEQEKELGVHFDAIVVAVGSGGTYAGLLLASKTLHYKADIIGINVCDDEYYFRHVIDSILQDSGRYLQEDIAYAKQDFHIIDGYVGQGYGISSPEVRQFIFDFAKLEGVILDPVYTGKALFGLVEEIKKGRFNDLHNILFIHTGGLFGLFPQKHEFINPN